MTGHETSGVRVVVSDAERPRGSHEAFQQGVIGEVTAYLDAVPDISDEWASVYQLAELRIPQVVPYLDRMWQDLYANGIEADDKGGVSRLAVAYVQTGQFGTALAIADTLDRQASPQAGRIDQKTVIFKHHKEDIPADYLEQAVWSLSKWGNPVYGCIQLSELGEAQSAAQPIVLERMRQMIDRQPATGTQTAEQRDFLVGQIIYYAAKWGDAHTARAYYNQIPGVRRRLELELQAAETARILLGHRDLTAVHDDIMREDIGLSAHDRVDMLLQLQAAGYPLDASRLRDGLDALPPGIEKLKLISTFAKQYNDAAARQQLAASITAELIKNEPTAVYSIAKEHPGLLAVCETAVVEAALSCGNDDGMDEFMLEGVLGILLDDYVAMGRPNWALELVGTHINERFFEDIDPREYQKAMMINVAKQGRERFGEALTMFEIFTRTIGRRNRSYEYGSLIATLVVAAEYLTSEEQDHYLGTCRSDYMKYCGWLKLAKARRNVDYLFRAKQYVKPEGQAEEPGVYLSSLIELLEAYHEITTPPKTAHA